MIEPLRIVEHISEYSAIELERFADASYLRSGALCPTAFGIEPSAIEANMRLARQYEQMMESSKS